MVISDGIRKRYGADSITDEQIVRNIFEEQYPDMKYRTLNTLVKRTMGIGDTFTIKVGGEIIKRIDVDAVCN